LPPESGYIETDRGSLFRVLHRPQQEPHAAVLLLPPCADEQRAAYGACVRLARALCAGGAAVLRFDYFGTGDSAGESSQVTLSGMRHDAELAAAHLAELAPGRRLCLLGVRMGASLGLRLAADISATRVAAVAPVISGSSWLRQERGRKRLRRSMVRKEMAAAGAGAGTASGDVAELPPGIAEDLDGLPVSETFGRELEEFDLTESTSGDAPPALLVQISPRRTPLPEMTRAAECFGARVECLRLEPFWQPLEPPDLDELSSLLGEFLLGGKP
jgi:predicted alpha/beta hydrolase